MPPNKTSSKEPLRQRAEKLVSDPSLPHFKIEKDDLQKVVHELQVHQIELEMQNEELRRAQEEIEASRQKYSDLYDFAPIGYFTFSPSGEILGVNLTGASLLNIERAKLINRPFSVFVASELRSQFREYCRNLLSTDKSERCELKLIRDDGKSFDVSLQGISVRYDNTLVIRCAVSDITELRETQNELQHLNTELKNRVQQRTAELEITNQKLREEITDHKSAEEALYESELRLRLAQEHGHIGVWDWRPERREEDFSREMNRIYGIPTGTIRTYEDWLSRVHPDDVKRMIAERDAAIARHEPFDLEFRIFHGSGDIRWICSRGGAEYDETGRVKRVLGVNFDVTERKHGEEALKRSEEKYRNLIKYAPTGIYEVDFRIPRFSSVNDVMCQYLGYTREELLQMNPSDIMDEKNASLFGERIRRQLNGEKIDDSVEYKVRAKDGRDYYAVLNITFTYEDGKPKGAMVIAHDITERKQAEEALRANQSFLNSIMENTPDPIYVKDNQSRIIMANPSLAKVVGKPLEEIIGRTDSEYYGDPVTGQMLREHDLRVMKSGRSEMTEETVPTPDGFRTFISAKTPYYSASGDIIGITGISRDITERKQAEEALKKAYEEMEKRVQDRTSELAETVERLRLDNLQRKWLEETLRESEKQVRFFASQCLTAQETERKRIAGELHDSIAASIAAAKFKIENIAEQMKQGNGGPDSLDDISSRLIEINNEVRRIMADLRPSILDDLGIIPAIDWFCREYQKTYSHLSVDHHIAVSEDEVPDSLKTPIFRISQEAMNNIAKHGQASHVNLSLQKENRKMLLTVKDNGNGFDLGTVRKGMGLSTMRERAELSGGSFAIESTEGKGTVIRVRWPLDWRLPSLALSFIEG